jgi:16S rRNA (guanine527-N7)-methyltransferase
MALSEAQKSRLVSAARDFGANLGEAGLAQFDRITDLLLEWNARINLTGLKDVDDIVDKHYIDSLAGHPHIAPDAFVLDIGTGAGFPGLALKIAGPQRRLLLIDGTQKKITYVQTVIRELGLQGISALAQRAEDKAFQTGLQGHLDVVTARAVAATETLIALGTPFLKRGGRLILYKGMAEAEETLTRNWNGFERPELHPLTLPRGDQRAILVFRRKG